MISNSDAGAHAAFGDRGDGADFVRLACEADRFRILPLSEPPAFIPFAVPRVPVSLLGWCGTLANLFRGRNDRCLGCFMSLDPIAGRWRRAVIPHQLCQRDRTAMDSNRLTRSDVPAGCVIGGSSQTCIGVSQNELPSLLPTFDGVHVVDLISADDDEDVTPHCFIRAGGVVQRIGAEAIVLDDWVQALRHHADRLRLD